MDIHLYCRERPGSPQVLSPGIPAEGEKSMYEEQYNPPHLDFNLSTYERDENGLISNIEEAREIIRNLQKIVRFLEVSPFEQLSLNTQAEISLYLVGTHLLTHIAGQQDPQYEAKITLLETLFNAEFDEVIQRGKTTLSTDEILQSVEALFQDFGK